MRLGKVGTALVAALLIAGCGGDDGGSSSADDEKAIAAVATKALSTTDPQIKCAEVVTEKFVTTVYGSLVNCKTEEAKPDESKPSTGAAVKDLKIDGDRATGDVTAIGGDAAGSHGQVTFAKEGDDWKLDELSAAILLSRMTVQVGASREGPFADATVRQCFVDEITKLGDAEFLRVAYDGMAGRDPHPKFLAALEKCATGVEEGGVTVLRKQFEAGITEAARKDNTPQKSIDCVNGELRKLITDQEILQLSENQAELGKRVATAMSRCNVSP